MHTIDQFIAFDDFKNLVGGRKLISDFDGVILDTARASIEAYKLAGAAKPERCQTMHWSEWVDADLHDRKTEIYKYVAPMLAKVLPLASAVKILKGRVLTCCATESFLRLNEHFELDLELLAAGITKQQKVIALGGVEDDWFYIDDDKKTCEVVASFYGEDKVGRVL